MTTCKTDLIIIGAGPAGLSAAINAASEGLTIRIIDQAAQLGGQARESNAIENYLGFPDGVTGDRLMSSAVRQARKFGNITIDCPANVVDLFRSDDGILTVVMDDFRSVMGRAVILANGLTYRRLAADNLGAVMGRGVYYGASSTVMPANKKCNVAIVGGANSAGQAAVKLAENLHTKIKMYIRKHLDTQMSHYLVDRIRATPNIEVCEGCEVVKVSGDEWLTGVTYVQGSTEEHTDPTHYMYIFIGAQPRTMWLRDRVQLDENNYIVTGGGVKDADNSVRQPMYYETSMQGVFAAGDVRSQSTKRIATAIGEGSAVVSMVHQYLAL